MFAALNSVEPPIMMLNFIDLQPGGVPEGAKALRETVAGRIGMRLDNLAAFLGDREHLVAGRFTAADLLMTTVLRILRNTDLVAQRPRSTPTSGAARRGRRSRRRSRPSWRRSRRTRRLPAKP